MALLSEGQDVGNAMITWQWTPYIVPLLLAAIVCGALAAYLVRNRGHETRAMAGAAILLAGAWWTLGYAIELASADLQSKVFWAKAQYVGIVIIPSAWLVYVLEYTSREKWLTLRRFAWLSLVPVIVLVLVFTNEAHGLMWRDVTLVSDGSTRLLVQDMNVGFYVFLAYATTLVLVGSILLLQMFARWRTLYRRQIRVLVTAAAILGGASLLDPIGVNPFPAALDLEPFMFAVIGPLVAWGLFHLRLGDILPVANELIIKGMGDAVIVLDAHDRVVEINPIFEALAGCAAAEVIGQPVGQVWSEWPGYVEESGTTISADEVVLGRSGPERSYDMRVSPIADAHGNLLGRVVVLRDITERKMMEQELYRLNEKLEVRIASRTAALSEANARLAREIADREQMQEELLRRNRELLSLQAATAATSSSLDLPFVLETVTWEMADLLHVDRCAVYEWRRDSQEIALLAEYGDVHEPDGPLAYDLAGLPLRKRVLVERSAQQVSSHQLDADPVELTHMQQTGTETLLLLPMVFQDHVVGLVEIKQDRAERTFGDAEISLAQLLANQAAVAVENAQLYERAQTEIAERMRAEAQIKASLDEKVVLLKEIHHRVKNNLQVISSLLNLQSRNIRDSKTLETLRDSQNRIRSMALIHEKLYRSQDLARIDFAEYVRNLTAFLIRSYRAEAASAELSVESDDIHLSIDSAVPCGLIINELVSNALKYAFPDGRRGRIRVIIRNGQDRSVHLTISDDGIGFPGDLDFRKTESLGLQLVNTLVDQLEGSVELRRDGGTTFEIAFANT